MWSLSTHSLDWVRVEVLLGFLDHNLIYMSRWRRRWNDQNQGGAGDNQEKQSGGDRGLKWIRWWPMWSFSTHSLDSVQVEVLLGFLGPYLISKLMWRRRRNDQNYKGGAGDNQEEIEGLNWIRWWPMWSFSTHSLDSVQVEVLLGFLGHYLISGSTSGGEGDQDQEVQIKSSWMSQSGWSGS